MANQDHNPTCLAESPDYSSDPDLLKAKEAVDNLCNFRDTFFEVHGLEKGKERVTLLHKEIDNTLEVLEQFKESKSHLAEYHLLLGKTLNIRASYQQAALESLTKAVKLKPKLTEAWSELGECYWLKNDIAGAYNCFLGALKKGKCKEVLRKLSMTLRQLQGSSEERAKHIQESVDVAKEAVTLDFNDGLSWLILGNAYLAQFFASSQDPRLLQQAASAYEKAMKDKKCEFHPDLYFNRAVLFKYKEQYDETFKNLEMAEHLDPEWGEPTAKLQSLIRYLDHVQTMVHNKGGVKAKKLEKLLAGLGLRDLGSYGGGQYTSKSGLSISLSNVPLSHLQPELNKDTVVVGKVVGSVVSEEKVPFTFGLVDRWGTCYAVSVYNIAPGAGVKISDSVAIPEPYVERIQVTYKDKTWDFPSIRVSSPLVLVVNGRKGSRELVAATAFSSTVQGDFYN